MTGCVHSAAILKLCKLFFLSETSDHFSGDTANSGGNFLTYFFKKQGNLLFPLIGVKLGDSDWFGCVFSVIVFSFSFLVESRSLEDRFLGSLGSLVVDWLFRVVRLVYLFGYLLLSCVPYSCSLWLRF